LILLEEIKSRLSLRVQIKYLPKYNHHNNPTVGAFRLVRSGVVYAGF
jgi:hypothetical protein